jgi:uncharacterized protein (DUF1697 family)
MVYVALLRGINVGGKARVEMARLKVVFEQLGCTQVLTYINSGNVLFVDPRPAATLVPLIEAAIEREFSLPVRVVLRDYANISLLNKETPANWTNDTAQKTDVMFLWDELDNESIMQKLMVKPDLDRVRYLPGAIIWNVDRSSVTRSGMMRLAGSPEYKLMTIRNVNTLRKLYALMSAIQEA